MTNDETLRSLLRTFMEDQDQAAFEEFYREVGPQCIEQVMACYGCPLGQAEDATQTAFTKLVSYMNDRGLNPTHPVSYVYQSARNAYISAEIRTKTKLSAVGNACDVAIKSERWSPDSIIDKWEDNPDLRLDMVEALSRLGPTQEKIVQMSIYDSLSQRQIAKRMGITQQMVCKHRASAMTELRIILQEYANEGEIIEEEDVIEMVANLAA